MTTGLSTIAREYDADEKEVFERALKLLESQLAKVGAHLTIDSATRIAYSKEMSNNKLAIAGQELASTSASNGGGLAGGALAGLACGPAAPVCVTIGAFVGGAVAAFGVRLFW